MNLKLAFCLFAYFPYGGLQSDFMRIAAACRERGHEVDVLTMTWQGRVPAGFRVKVIPVRGLRGHTRNRLFVRGMQQELQRTRRDCVIGFVRVPGLDVYFAADPCFEARVRRLRHPLYRATPRYRAFSAYERAVFERTSKTQILMLTDTEISEFRRYYGTQAERFHVLPPGIRRDRMAPENAEACRHAQRHHLGCADDQLLILFIGSGFRTKGLDRALRALSSLPQALRERSRLLVVGSDRSEPFSRLARRLQVADRVDFVGGRDDIPQLLFAGDLLLHPAYSESAGAVLLEAVVAGLPVLTTDVCGYAHHIQRAEAGKVLTSPFSQAELDSSLSEMLTSATRAQWSRNGIAYGRREDLYSMPEVAARLIEELAPRR